MEILIDDKFAKLLMAFTVFLGAAMMLTIISGIFIATGEPSTTCIPFSIASLGAIVGTLYTARKMMKL